MENLDREIERYREVVRNTLRKDKRINIRISSRDLKAINVRALKKGIPYQTTSVERSAQVRRRETARENWLRTMLSAVPKTRTGRSRRVSSYDATGRNEDFWPISSGETKVLADLSGASIVRHISFTINCSDVLYLRKCVLRMYWDGQDHPSVETPVGDFFGVGHAKVNSYEHGHANDRTDDWSSVAYWYQDLPSKPFPQLPPVQARLPRRAVTVQAVDLPAPLVRPTTSSDFRPELHP